MVPSGSQLSLGLQRFREAFWYQTIWFRYALIFSIGAFGAVAVVLVQRRRHVLAQEALKSRYDAVLAERARIAQELHDTLLQGFTGITIQLRAIQRVLGRQPNEGATALETVLTSADGALREARNAIWDMRAVDLEGRNLAGGARRDGPLDHDGRISLCRLCRPREIAVRCRRSSRRPHCESRARRW